jgi:tetratricopeptide (TPR) repeat protein
MTPRLWTVLLAGSVSVSVLLLGGAASLPGPDQLLRQGNDAFNREDYAAAVDWYTHAEEQTTDPGLVAFDKAAALYRLAEQNQEGGRRAGLFREAELHYRRSLEDATGDRRAAALYGLGNALVQQGQALGAQALQEAIGCYRECLRLNAREPEPADVRHNLELARILWLQAKSSRNKPDSGSEDKPEQQEPPPKPDPARGQQPGEAEPAGGDVRPGGGEPKPVQLQPGDKPIQTDQRGAPGKGQLPPVPDEDKLVPLPPEDATAHLQRALDRILKERREHQQRSARTPSASVKDW